MCKKWITGILNHARELSLLTNPLVNSYKRLVSGYEAPIYTVTGWNSIYGAEIPVEEVVPVFGAYVEAPWADSTDKLPLSPHYVFNTTRNDTAIGADLIKDSNESGWQLPYENYPYATCELGAGLHSTHRILYVSRRNQQDRQAVNI